jgi:predicted DNA-binding transcriptional regulator YafY
MFGKRENKTVGTPAAIKAVILEAMKTHNVVKVQYTSENHETLTRDIEPLYTKGNDNLALGFYW